MAFEHFSIQKFKKYFSSVVSDLCGASSEEHFRGALDLMSK